jgi:hypothetical protein
MHKSPEVARKKTATTMLGALFLSGSLIASSAVQAGLLFIDLVTGIRTEAFNISNLPTYGVGTSLALGTLATDAPGTITFTYLGQESSFVDKFYLGTGAPQVLLESHAVGTAISAVVGTPGDISFKFEGAVGKFAINGGTWDAGTSIGLIGENMTINSGGAAGTYAYVLGYNDSAGAARLGDWDDFVVGVNFVPSSRIAAVPEPSTYPMLVLGLALMLWVGRPKTVA